MNTETEIIHNRRAYQTAAFGIPEYEMKKEGTYKPCISPERLFKLWVLKQQTKKPITKLVAEALDLYFLKAERG